MMNFPGAKLGLSFILVLLTLAVGAAKAIDVSEPEPYRKSQVEYGNASPEDVPSETELLKYLLTRELLSRRGGAFDWEDRQRKRSYWKQCAFNAVSCFGRK